MSLNETLKERRRALGLSQEKVAEQLGVSRQAVTKWEAGQSVPSPENLLALARLYETSLDELTEQTVEKKGGPNPILRSNLTLLAIGCQATALNVCVQVSYTMVDGVLQPERGFMGVKLTVLLLCSLWMAWNQRYEKDLARRRKNARIELLYCLLQAAVALGTVRSGLYFPGALLILALVLGYVLVINPRYMNRQLVRSKERKKA